MSDIMLPDGTDALMAELSFSEVMRLIERIAKWVDPQTFKLLPVWYPEHARRGLLYKSNWSEILMSTNRQTGESVHKAEANIYARIGFRTSSSRTTAPSSMLDAMHGGS